MPRGFNRAEVGKYSMERADRLAATIIHRIRSAKPHRPYGVAMDRDGMVYAVKHLTTGFQRVLKFEQGLVVGVYNIESTTPNLADDIRAHAKELGL